MRINVYAEEITTEVELVTKTAPTGREFYGIRIYLESPDKLHHSPDDDDRSAITFWLQWTKADGYDYSTMLEVARQIVQVISGLGTHGA